MCFSAQASFLAGSGLTAFGVYLLKTPHKKTERSFLAIPLMFGIQQLFEGVVWITQIQPDLHFYNNIGKYGFLLFAFFVWPIWIPFSLLQLEKAQKNKFMLSLLLGAGSVVATCLAWLSFQLGVSSTISCNHIEYILDIPPILALPGIIWYCIAAICPFFIIKKKYMKEFGLLLLSSVIVSAYFYWTWFTSVWCFFAALLSFFIYKIHQK
jgi:hypothetical protein